MEKGSKHQDPGRYHFYAGEDPIAFVNRACAERGIHSIRSTSRHWFASIVHTRRRLHSLLYMAAVRYSQSINHVFY